jgi:death-on-curing protein
MPDYLTIADVLAMHADQIERYGGADGIRDPGQLEAALFRPQTGYYPDLIAEAAAMWESLSQNHPFVDGNKRTAFAASIPFWPLTALKSQRTPTVSGPFYLNFMKAALLVLNGWMNGSDRIQLHKKRPAPL